MKLPTLNLKSRIARFMLVFVVPAGTMITMMFASSGVASAAVNVKECNLNTGGKCLSSSALTAGTYMYTTTSGARIVDEDIYGGGQHCYNGVCYYDYKLLFHNNQSLCIGDYASTSDVVAVRNCSDSHTLWSRCSGCDAGGHDKWLSPATITDHGGSTLYLLSGDNVNGDLAYVVADHKPGWYQYWCTNGC